MFLGAFGLKGQHSGINSCVERDSSAASLEVSAGCSSLLTGLSDARSCS